jgi:hypothetical protein
MGSLIGIVVGLVIVIISYLVVSVAGARAELRAVKRSKAYDKVWALNRELQEALASESSNKAFHLANVVGNLIDAKIAQKDVYK